jgi:hypothetical protein
MKLDCTNLQLLYHCICNSWFRRHDYHSTHKHTTCTVVEYKNEGRNLKLYIFPFHQHGEYTYNEFWTYNMIKENIPHSPNITVYYNNIIINNCRQLTHTMQSSIHEKFFSISLHINLHSRTKSLLRIWLIFYPVRVVHLKSLHIHQFGHKVIVKYWIYVLRITNRFGVQIQR